MDDKKIERIIERLYNIDVKFRGHRITMEQYEELEDAVSKLRSCYAASAGIVRTRRRPESTAQDTTRNRIVRAALEEAEWLERKYIKASEKTVNPPYEMDELPDLEYFQKKIIRCVTPSKEMLREAEVNANRLKMEIIQQAEVAMSRKLSDSWCVEVLEDPEEVKYDNAMKILEKSDD